MEYFSGPIRAAVIKNQMVVDPCGSVPNECLNYIGFVFNNRDRNQAHGISVSIPARKQRKNRAY